MSVDREWRVTAAGTAGLLMVKLVARTTVSVRTKIVPSAYAVPKAKAGVTVPAWSVPVR